MGTDCCCRLNPLTVIFNRDLRWMDRTDRLRTVTSCSYRFVSSFDGALSVYVSNPPELRNPREREAANIRHTAERYVIHTHGDTETDWWIRDHRLQHIAETVVRFSFTL
jgi:hypothetical protein